MNWKRKLTFLGNNLRILRNEKNIFIKIDCQGAEIPILKGSEKILSRTDFIVIEMPLFGQYNEGVPNFLEQTSLKDKSILLEFVTQWPLSYLIV